MKNMFVEGGRALLGQEIVETSIEIADGKISAVGAEQGRGRLASMPAAFWCCPASSICMAMHSSGR